MSLSSAIRSSDRKASHLLGVTLTRDPTFLRSLGKRLQRSHRRSRPYYGEDGVVWDVPNPFAAPDPALAHLRALIQEEIARARRVESIGPHYRVHGVGDNEDDEDSDDEDDDFDDADADDEEEDDIEDFYDEDKPASISLPRLLPIPLRFVPSPSPSPSPSPPPPSPAPTSDEDYNDTAEAEARAARRAKRDAHRSRSKALAILGPEARSAL